MPFTLAHPAAVLPLRHLRGLRTAPLVIGAMVPDAPYYLQASHRLLFDTHGLVGSCLLDLPLGILLLAAAVLLRDPLTALLSARARWLGLHALEPFRQRASEWLLAPLAILIGVWAHLLWDSFTHGDGWIVRHVAALRQIVVIGGYSVQVCHLLQYLSSIIGLAIMLWWYLRLRAPTTDAAHAAWLAHAGPALLLVAGAALLIGGVEAQLVYSHSDGAVYRTLDVLLTRSVAWFLLLNLIGGTIVTLEQRATAARHDLRP
ncbi:MAG TPA: DUF4184 family protein [Steroidobacteraceae bacterium]|nr:DUF4184 family protein [Steroidobacteraceae bacterium]